MTDNLTITGLVATAPRHITTADGFAVTSFRLASNLRRFDRNRNEWVDAGTNWYTVSSYRNTAVNVAASVNKGDRVIVTGRLRIREWGDGEKKGLNIELDADALGHDLGWGKSAFTRNIQSAQVASFAPTTTAVSGTSSEESDETAPAGPPSFAAESAEESLTDTFPTQNSLDSVVSELEPNPPF